MKEDNNHRECPAIWSIGWFDQADYCKDNQGSSLLLPKICLARLLRELCFPAVDVPKSQK
jgi:hypothetical protein